LFDKQESEKLKLFSRINNLILKRIIFILYAPSSGRKNVLRNIFAHDNCWVNNDFEPLEKRISGQNWNVCIMYCSR